MAGEKIQWHPGFVETFKLEGGTDTEKLQIYSEYPLGSKPKEIDILAIKVDDNYECRQDIMRIFRKHNIVEYKGPEDSLSVNDYYKIIGYANFYIGDAEHILEICPADVTITFVCNRYPRELMRHLWNSYGITPVNAEAGIYYLDGSTFPIQIIVNHQLDPEKYLWLYSLRGELSEEELLAVLNDYEGKKEEKRYQSAMELILRANWALARRMMNMCQALEELLADKYREKEEIGEKRGIALGIQQGEQTKLLSMVKKKLVKGIDLAEIADMLEEELSVIQNCVKELEQAV